MESPVSQITTLASRIAANTNKLEAYLVADNLPTPSFDVEGPKDTLVPKHEVDVEAARVAIIDDTETLRRLVLGPREYLMSYTHNELISQQAIVRFGIANSFPIGGEASFSEIAAKTGLPETNVRQVIRHAIVKDIFVESRTGVIAHNAVSRLLAEDKVIHDWVASTTDELWSASAHTCNALMKYPGSQEPNETGFALANNTTDTIYEVFSKHPERARKFANSMRSFTEGTGFELSHVVDGFDWGDLPEGGVVVDVGGSQGFASFAIAEKYTSLSFIVQDLELTIRAAEKLEPQAIDLADRVKFMVHDFFNKQPVHGAEVYFFRWILHNWSDKYCIKILRNLIPALKHGAKIVMNDGVLPEPGVMSRWQEERLRSMDLAMTAVQNSHERELDYWADLFKRADSRFEFKGGMLPTGANLWLMVAEWKGE